MGNGLHGIQTVSRRDFLMTRIPHVIRLVLVTLILAFFVLILITPSIVNAIGLGAIIVAIFVVSLALLYSALRLLQMNPVGLYQEGIVPPEKLLAHALENRFLIPWNQLSYLKLTAVEEDPVATPGMPSKYYIATMKLKSGEAVEFHGSEIAKRFRSDVQARKFHALLNIVKENKKDGPAAPLRLSDSRVQAVLAATWPEEYTFRRSIASRTGIIIGGIFSLIALLLALLRLIDIVTFAVVWIPTLSIFLLSLGFPKLPAGISHRR